MSFAAASKEPHPNNIPTHAPLATFNTGLVDRRYEPIFCLFEVNAPGYDRDWRFAAFCVPGEKEGKLLARHLNPLPEPARYFSTTSELLFDPDAPLHLDYNHILKENRERLPHELLASVAGMTEEQKIFNLKMHLLRAVDIATKRSRWNYKTAVPHYFPTFKRLEFLLPLCLVEDGRVDVALAVQKAETGYLGNTILELDWAYKSARLVCRPDSDWLAPEEIVTKTKHDEEEFD